MAYDKSKNNKNRGRGGKKPYNNRGTNKRPDKDKVSEVDTVETKYTDKGNDPAWYFRNPQLNTDSGSFNFSQALGLPLDLHQNTGAMGVHGTELIIPGLCVINYIPGIGFCDPSASNAPTAVDLAGQSIYGYVVHANSRTKQYDIPDLMMYYLACTDLYAAYSDLVRAYGICRWFNVYNRYYPKRVLKALGYDPDDLIQHMAEFRYQINQIAVALTSLCVPNKFTIFNRQTWLPQNLFLDHPGMKSQTYAFVPKTLHRYKPYESIKGGYLQGFEWRSLTWQQKCSTLREMLSELLSNQDIGMMSGDTLKAFGESNLLRVNMIKEDYFTAPVYDETVLSQIENLTIVGGETTSSPATDHVPSMKYLFDIYQDPDVSNRLVYKPTITKTFRTTPYCLLQKVINIRHDNPTSIDLFEATRLAASGTTQNSVSKANMPVTIALEYIGTEVVHSISFYSFDTQSGYYLDDNIQPLDVEDDINLNRIVIDRLSKCMAFRQHPSVFVQERFFADDNPNEKTEIIRPYIDWANYTLLDNRELNNMHQTALLSMYDVPFNGTMK